MGFIKVSIHMPKMNFGNLGNLLRLIPVPGLAMGLDLIEGKKLNWLSVVSTFVPAAQFAKFGALGKDLLAVENFSQKYGSAINNLKNGQLGVGDLLSVAGGGAFGTKNANLIKEYGQAATSLAEGDLKGAAAGLAGNGMFGADVKKDMQFATGAEKLASGNPSGLLDVPGINGTFDIAKAAEEAKIKSLLSKAV